MVDEVPDNRTTKHLTICTQFIDQKDIVQNRFITDLELPNVNANAITTAIITKLHNHDLPIQDMTGITSDGAAVFVG